MKFLNFTNDISSEILLIYALIALVVGLIFIIMYLDKKEKKRVTLAKTQELRLMDLRRSDDNYIEEYKRVEEIEEVKEKPITHKEEMVQVIKEEICEIEIDEDMYIEDDLEKTQAQLHLEALTKELQKVQETESDKITRFEEEQEENAIISYKELLKVCDKLYDDNEKVQYMDEGDEPITISQLRNKFNNNSDNIEVL